MASEGTLPEELLLKIFGSINDCHSLFNVVSVSHLFRRLGELLLYKSVAIRDSIPEMSRISQFHRTITTRKHLRACLKSLTLIVEDNSENRSNVVADTPLDLVYDILCKLPSLQKLRVHCNAGSCLNLPASSLVLPCALTHLRWSTSSDDGNLLSAILESQSTLECVDIKETNFRAQRLSAGALPHLRILLSDAITAFYILPTRHISHLGVAMGRKDIYRMHGINVRSLDHVQSLQCSAKCLEDATNFAARFPNLMFLSLSCDSTLNGGVRTMANQASKRLLSLSSKKIEYITLTFEVGCLPKMRKIRALFSAFPKLLAVDFRTWRKDPRSYHRYTRQSSSPILGRDRRKSDDWDLWWQRCDLGLGGDSDVDTPSLVRAKA